MKIKVQEATRPQLDWLVATCWWHDEFDRKRIWLKNGKTRILNNPTEFPESWMYSVEWSPTNDWSQGGPIIEREGIHPTVEYSSDVFGEPIARCGWRACAWNASTPGTSGFMVWGLGETLLIAAMRCFVVSKLGNEVEVPDDLV